jgi:rhodanese-related sulfurtransferase
MRVLMIGMAVLLAVGLAAEMALIQPGDLAAQLATKGAHPAIFQVGPNVLYRGKHIPGSIYAGPASRPDGIALLKEAAGKLPRNREIVLYCAAVRGATAPT